MAEAAIKEDTGSDGPTASTRKDGPLADAVNAASAAAPRPRSSEASPSILGIEVDVQFVLGHARLSVASLMDLEAAQVVRMDRLVSDPIDVTVNGTLIAQAELVEDDAGLAVRIVRIVGPGRDG